MLIGGELMLFPEWYHERTEQIGPFEITTYGSDLSPSGPTNFGPVLEGEIGIGADAEAKL